VENEQTKSGLGAATVFDVIFAEDNLTSALLNVVAGRQGYAVALAQLRYETGTMVEDGEAGPTVDAARLLERP
jgi:outer membrane protein TolC